MNLIPDFETFARAYDAGGNQVVYTRLAADLDTPVSLMLKLGEARPDTFMLESVTGGEVRGRYSIIGLKPDLIWECRGTTARLNRTARFDRGAFTDEAAPPLDSLRALIAESRIAMPDDLPAAAAGLFGYLGYDMIRLVERLPDVNPDPIGLPDAVLMRPSVVAVLDGVKGEVTVVAPAWVRDGLSARAAYAQAAERVMDAVRDLERLPSGETRALGEAKETGEPVSNFTKEAYMAAVETAKDYIRAGDIFQVVPSQRWTQPFALPPFALYRSLRRTNPSPFMFFFNFGGFQIVGASPEILVRVFGRQVTIRPIAGTRPRGATPEADRALFAAIERVKEQMSDILKIQTREYIGFIKNFTENSNIMTKTFFIVVPYDPPVMNTGSGPASFLNRQKQTQASAAEIKLEQFEEHRSQLELRVSVVEQGLVRCGVRTIQLGTEEIVELFYKIFNPGDTEKPIPLN